MSNDYEFVRKWGRLVGSSDDYVSGQVALAREENAPPNAIYRGHDGHWHTTDDVKRPETRAALGLDDDR